MNKDQRLPAKAMSPESRSDAIIVSFAADWYERLRGRAFTAVIRKRTPTKSSPRWLYFYLNAPKGAICARAEIFSVERLGLSEASNQASQIAMRSGDIEKYFGARRVVGCFRLGRIEFAPHEVSTRELTSQLKYHPPQSFLVLSTDAKRVVDMLCGFPGRTTSTTRKQT